MQGESTQRCRLGRPDIVAGKLDTQACSRRFYFRLAGDKNAFFATGRMLPQTELLIGQDEGLRNVQPAVVTVRFPEGVFFPLSSFTESHVFLAC